MISKKNANVEPPLCPLNLLALINWMRSFESHPPKIKISCKIYNTTDRVIEIIPSSTLA